MRGAAENKRFTSYALPSVRNNKKGFEEWSEHPLVCTIKKAVESLQVRSSTRHCRSKVCRSSHCYCFSVPNPRQIYICTVLWDKTAWHMRR